MRYKTPKKEQPLEFGLEETISKKACLRTLLNINHKKTSVLVNSRNIDKAMLKPLKTEDKYNIDLKNINTLIRMHMERMQLKPQNKIDTQIFDTSRTSVSSDIYKQYTLEDISNKSRSLIQSFGLYSTRGRSLTKRKFPEWLEKKIKENKQNIDKELILAKPRRRAYTFNKSKLK